MDFSALMQISEKLRQELQRSQEEAQRARVTGEAGGGLVRVVLNGRYEAVEVTIDPKATSGDDRRLLEDLVRAAINQASARVSAEMQGRVGSFASSLGVDPTLLSSLVGK